MASFWTKRRKIQKRFESHVDNIKTNTGFNGPSLSSAETCDTSTVNPIEEASEQDEPETSDNDDLNSNSNSDASNDITADDASYSSKDSSSDHSAEPQNDELSLCLARWAVKNMIPHNNLRELLTILHPYHQDIPKDPRTLLSTGKVTGVKEIAGGSYFHFGLKSELQHILESSNNCVPPGRLDIQLNIDGLPLFKSTNDQFWPILGLLQHVKGQKPFVIGLFYGKTKPKNVHEYLDSITQEIGDLDTSDLIYDNKAYQVNISSVVCDTPARAYVRQVKGHSGYHGCDKCTQDGLYNKKMTFPEINSPLRTDESFAGSLDEDHHIGPNPWANVSLGQFMVTRFPLDPMHLVYLGITKRLLTLMTKGPLNCRIGSRVIQEISEYMLTLRNYIPKEFVRKPRSLNELDRWKATELRLFLLYVGPVVLLKHIPVEMYQNFMLLSVAIHFLTNECLCQPYADYANELLVNFVQHFGKLYGSDMFTYNVHCITHLTADVKIHGSLNKISAFPFESFLGIVKRLVRKPGFALEQVVLRIREQQKLDKQNEEASVLTGLCRFRKPHNRGPIPDCISQMCSQYDEHCLDNMTITTVRPDNCIRINNKPVLVKNILHDDLDNCYIVYNHFRESTSFFTYPLKSAQLDIHMVGGVTQGCPYPISQIFYPPISHIPDFLTPISHIPDFLPPNIPYPRFHSQLTISQILQD